MKNFKLIFFLILSSMSCSVINAQVIDGNKLSDKQIKLICKELANQHDRAMYKCYVDLPAICNPISNPVQMRTELFPKVYERSKFIVNNNLQSNSFEEVKLNNRELFHCEDGAFSLHLKGLARREYSPALYSALDELQTNFDRTSESYAFAGIVETFLNNRLGLMRDIPEKMILAGSAYTLSNSFTYWESEIANWELKVGQLTGARSGMNIFKVKGKSIAVADLKGAVTGLVRGAMAGAVGGTMTIPGVGTVVGGAACALTGLIGGAIIGSALNVLDQLFSSIFD